MNNKNVKNKTFINQLYDTWKIYKKNFDNSTNEQDAKIYKFIMCDIVYLYSEFTNTDYEVSKCLFNCAYDIGLNKLCSK